jgi:hypothetical protein
VSVPEGVSLERLLARLEELETRVAELEAENATLRAENAELTLRLARNSRNSSQPPSSDSPGQVIPPRSLRGKTGRKPGKQPGAPGFALELVDDPDVVIDHIPDACGGCGAELSAAMLVGVVRRQVTDVPVVTATVTEHRLQQRRCGCGTGAAVPGRCRRRVDLLRSESAGMGGVRPGVPAHPRLPGGRVDP